MGDDQEEKEETQEVDGWLYQISNECCIRREFNIQVKCKRALDYLRVSGPHEKRETETEEKTEGPIL